MRILLALDGSEPAGRARDLVDGIQWPAGTVIHVTAALERGGDLVGMPGSAGGQRDPRAIETSTVRRLQDTIDGAVLNLERPGRVVDRILLRGRPASAIVKEARSFGADLVIVGSRGHGQIRSMLLGSVSTEVVDQAPCPVLVARSSSVRSILYATDGSATAEHAEHVLTDWPILAGRPVTVLSVAEVGMPWSTGMSPGIYDQVLESYTEAVDDARGQCQAIAEAAAGRIAAAGFQTTAVVREGPSAEEIVAASQQLDDGLVVIASRGHTGLTRLVLGSVARSVLTHAPCSVLVVREKARVAAVEEA
jgi:nucleotide-binding universal stress UspA family protein